MNNVNELIQIEEITKSCRNLNPNELMSLLRSQPMKFICWGATDFTIDNKKNCKMFRMKVSGMKHKGYVYIVVNGSDLFDVYLTNYKGMIIQKSPDMGLYFDMLVDWIDDRIEKQDNYRF